MMSLGRQVLVILLMNPFLGLMKQSALQKLPLLTLDLTLMWPTVLMKHLPVMVDVGRLSPYRHVDRFWRAVEGPNMTRVLPRFRVCYFLGKRWLQ